MKTSLLVVLSLLLIGSVASAAEIILDQESGGSTSVTWDGRYPYSFTQNGDPSTFDAGTYTCGNTLYNYITDCWALRRFYFSDEGITVPFTVQSIDWGVRRFIALGDSVPGPYATTLYIGTIPVGLPFVFANISWVNQVDIPITTADNPPAGQFGVPKHTDITAVISDTVNNDLVVAWFAPITYYMTPRIRFAWSANNAGGYTWEAYFAFADCGFPEPATPTELGGAGLSNLVVVVNGDVYEPPAPGACCFGPNCTLLLEADCAAQGGVWYGGACDPNPCPPVPVENTSWGQIKANYR
jgi:hypothetical protein